jgi:glycosyltransferase involved in cell wall biosynthesis
MAHCHFMGPVSGDAKWQALADSDIFVFTPKAPEGHPWSLVEASAASLPIISTDRGAISQNVIDGQNGFLLADPEPRLLAEALNKLLSDPGLRTSMGAASRQLYAAYFTGHQMAERMGDVMEGVI